VRGRSTRPSAWIGVVLVLFIAESLSALVDIFAGTVSSKFNIPLPVAVFVLVLLVVATVALGFLQIRVPGGRPSSEPNSDESEILSGWRPVSHPLIFALAVTAELAIGLGVGLGLVQIVSPVSARVSLANGLANVGLIISIIAWITAIYRSFQYRLWLWLIGLSLSGIMLYASAYFYNDFLSYLLVSVAPGLFGVIGRRPEKS
jgi:hypothetical protein